MADLEAVRNAIITAVVLVLGAGAVAAAMAVPVAPPREDPPVVTDDFDDAVRLLGSADADERKMGVRMLASCADDRSVPALRTCANGIDPAVSGQAAVALARRTGRPEDVRRAESVALKDLALVADLPRSSQQRFAASKDARVRSAAQRALDGPKKR
jgi:hypothetical protein